MTFREIAAFKHAAEVSRVAFAPDGGSLATTCEDGLVRLWNLSTGKESLTLKGHHGPPSHLAFFPDGRRLATGSGDNTIKLWNLETRQEMLSVRHNSQITSLTVSPDGRKLASAAANRVRLWLTRDPASAGKLKSERLRELTLARKTPARKAPPAGAPGWSLHGVTPDRYETGIDPSMRHSGTASAFIKSIKPPSTAHVSVLQGIGAEAYRGKRVRLSGYIKTERVSQYAGLWMRVDGAGYSLNFDNMHSRPIRGTVDWKKYEVVLDVPEESFSLWFGFELVSEGLVWADDFQLEIVGSDVPANGQAGFGKKYRDEFMRLSEEERRLTEQKAIGRASSLPVTPANLNFEGSN